MSYGIYDTQDNCWIGGDTGPNVYEDEITARIAAQVYDVMMKHRPARTRAREYLGGANKLKDEVTAEMTSLEALQKIEKGGL